MIKDLIDQNRTYMSDDKKHVHINFAFTKESNDGQFSSNDVCDVSLYLS